VILIGKRMPGTEDGPAPDLQPRCRGQRYGGYHWPTVAGQLPGVGGAPVRASAREGATWPTPHGGRFPPFPAEVIGLVVIPAEPNAFYLGTSRFPQCVRAEARTVACRRRALEAVEKVVTTRKGYRCAVPLDALHMGPA
jgi:hypothetical protein